MPTPVRSERLRYYLADYDAEERGFLCHGFAFGLRIPIQGPFISRVSRNHVSATRNTSLFKRNIYEEILVRRILGPFATPACEPLIWSPLALLALIPKHEAGSFRLIHDLSFPRAASVHYWIARLLMIILIQLSHLLGIMARGL